MKLVLFDCDGTIVDSAHIIHECMVRTFIEFGRAEPEAALTRSIIGLTLDTAIARMLACEIDDEVAAMTARYKQHFGAYRTSGAPLEPLYDGMAELIARAAVEPEMILGIVTGKSRRGLTAILAHHGLSGHMVTSRTADDCPSKPHPAMVLECCAETGIDPEDAIVVGDAVYDMEMARAAGAQAIGVSWGYGATDALIRSGAHHLARRAEDIARLIGLKGTTDA